MKSVFPKEKMGILETYMKENPIFSLLFSTNLKKKFMDIFFNVKVFAKVKFIFAQNSTT